MTNSGTTAINRNQSERPAAALRGALQPVSGDVYYLRTLIANVFLVGEPGARSGEWVLVDAGIPGSAGAIAKAAETLFGRGSRPGAVILTHGHFDHVGALRELAALWDVPIYAHRLEFPYLTGRSQYPPPDPSVGGGMMARISPLYPRGPIDVGERLHRLPEDGALPQMPGWRWLHTPGHTAGHVSLFRDSDRLLISGDAFITVNQESARDVLRQRTEVSGPPAYYTQDWQAARRSVETLRNLEPSQVAPGHGLPLGGSELATGLERLASEFDRLAVPRRGRYVDEAVVANESGIVSVPKARRGWAPMLLMGAALVTAGVLLANRGRTESRNSRFNRI